MQVTSYNDIQIVKYIVEKVIKKYDTIIFDNILESCDAPTKRREEILIELFPVNPIDYENETIVNEQYISDCHKFANELQTIFQNEIATGIDDTNNWAFIYIIL